HWSLAGGYHGGGVALPEDRVTAPHSTAKGVGGERFKLGVAQPVRRLDGDPLDRVQMPIEDSSHRAVGAGHPSYKVELGGGRWAARSAHRVPAHRAGVLKGRDGSLGERRGRGGI